MTSTDQISRTRITPTHSSVTWPGELRSLFVLAWPLVVAQLARNALFTTDVILMGWLGSRFLAGGTLATSFFNPFLLFAVGLVGAVAPMVAQALGRRDRRAVRRVVRQGLWVSLLLGAVLLPVIWQIRPLLTLLGQADEVTVLSETFMRFAVWSIFPTLMLAVLQSFLSAHGDTRIILIITLGGVVLNALVNYGLMFGNFGLPRLELMGSGIGTTLVSLVMLLATLWYILTHRRYRRYHIMARFLQPDWERFFAIFRIGLPIGLTIMSEVGLFSVAAILMGWLSTDELAAHAIALQCASLAFMVPLGLGHATTVRVGLAAGAMSAEGVRKAGWTALAMGTAFMGTTCLLFILFPGVWVGFFLDARMEQNQATLVYAATFLGIAGLFQLVDGAQVIAASALRGLSDTKVPMLLAFIGYWAVGLPISYICGFVLNLRGAGIWFGLAASLATVAVVLCARFAMRERLGLLERVSPTSTSRTPH